MPGTGANKIKIVPIISKLFRMPGTVYKKQQGLRGGTSGGVEVPAGGTKRSEKGRRVALKHKREGMPGD